MLRAEKDQTRPWRQLVDGVDQIFRPGHGQREFAVHFDCLNLLFPLPQGCAEFVVIGRPIRCYWRLNSTSNALKQRTLWRHLRPHRRGARQNSLFFCGAITRRRARCRASRAPSPWRDRPGAARRWSLPTRRSPDRRWFAMARARRNRRPEPRPSLRDRSAA